MKVIVIGSRYHGTKNDPSLISQRLQDEGAENTLLYWEDLTFDIAKNAVVIRDHGEDIFSTFPDLIVATGWYKSGKQSIYRDVAYSLALIAQSKGIAFWNSEMGEQRSTTKLSCMVQLALNGVEVPVTKFSLSDFSYITTMALPFIAKAVAASRGRSNYLVSTEAERNEVLETAADTRYLVQPFLPNDHDLRVVCFNGKPQLVLRRSRQAESLTHLNNTSQGGDSTWVELSDIAPEILTVSKRICIVMKREMAGIDFIPDPTSSYGYSCLEVNAIPQLTSGKGVDKKLSTFVQSIMTLKEEAQI